MSSVFLANSPVHSESMISQEYGVVTTGSCGFHTGVDIIPHGATVANPEIYPVYTGQVVYINTDQTNALRFIYNHKR